MAADLTFDWVSKEEAAQASAFETAPGRAPAVIRGLPRVDAPSIRLVAPTDTRQILVPPLRIELAFVPATGAQIVPASFRVLYGLLRIDLTERMRRHVTVTPVGVVIDGAILPEGSHRFFLQIGDDRGAQTEQEIQVRVGPPRADPMPAARVAPLLALVLQSAGGEMVRQGLGGAAAGLFERLRKRLVPGAESPDPAASAAPTTRVGPALGYEIDRLDPSTFETLQAIAVGGGELPALRTGDVMAIRFSTSLPGLVRLENIGPAGQVSSLGTYRVRADQLNRIPRERGIRLEGEPGIERLRFYFQPCRIEPTLMDAPGQSSNDLPPCAAASLASLQAAAQGELSARVLVNLEQPDPTMAFAGTTEFRPNEVTVLETRIRHEPPR